MAYQLTGTSSSGVWNAVKGALNIFSGLNKSDGLTDENNPNPIGVYDSTLEDKDILELIGQWKASYRKYYNDGVEASQTLSFEYWLGKHRNDDLDQVKTASQFVDNKIFEAIETFIPIATRANPDPLVKADPGDLGQQLAKDIKEVLVYEADRLKLRMALKGMLRNWMIYRLGIIKVGFDPHTQQTTIEKINPKRWMGDKDGYWENGFFTGEWQAETKRADADKLMEMFPDKAEKILEKAGDKKGTKLEYIEWWYRNRDVFYTLDTEVLGKFKNPHWNFDQEQKDPVVDEMGVILEPGQDFIEGKNLFKSPRAPYIGLCIFSTSIQPHDETSLILQNVSIQDRINKTARQIDRNVEGMNNALVVSKDFTAEQASLAASALRRGTAIRAATTNVRDGVMRLPPNGLPADVFHHLDDMRNELRNIFGTSGSTPEGVDSQQTVRGKILVNQLDSSRIGGGITEYLEACADALYNWFVQIMFVHWTDPHFIVAAGSMDGASLIQIKNTDLMLVKTLDITVKDGTLIPKDPLTQRNEAIDLWSAGAIDPITFYTRLDSADPQRDAERLLTWQMVQKGLLPPQAYLPTFGQNNPVIQQQQQMQQMQQQMGQAGAGAPNLPQTGVGGPQVNSLGASNPGGDKPDVQAKSQSAQLLDSIPLT